MKIAFQDRPVIFVDLEASGLGRESYPIEVGWSVDDEQEPASFLVRPATSWRFDDFTEAAQAIHNILYERLISHGIAVETACRRLDAAWTGAVLVSDNPAADGGWLNRLYQAASRPYPWRLVDFDVLDAALAIQYGGGYEKLAAILNDADRHWPVPHRAGPDAQRLHKIARAIVDPRYREALTGH